MRVRPFHFRARSIENNQASEERKRRRRGGAGREDKVELLPREKNEYMKQAVSQSQSLFVE